MYGCGALLIREVVRRTGHGWATILVLGAAYGVLEPGVFDGSLFNPSFEGMDFTAGYVPALGFSPYYLLHFAVGHAVWSITIPIVLVEALTAGRRKTPWLGTVGLAVIALGYVLGGLLIQRAMRDSGDFHTSAAQAIGTGLGAAVLVLIAFRVGRRSAGPAAEPAPRPLVVGIGAFVMSSIFFAMTEGWPGFVASVLLLAVAAAVVARLSRRPGWQDRHRLALASGALFTYAWGGFVLTWLKYRMDPVSLVGNAVFALGAVVLVVVAWRRSTRDRGVSGPESTIMESDGGRTGAGRPPR
jgi:hypothetical protein